MNTGSNYQDGRDVKDTAKLIRKALKAAYKGLKFSVTISRYSGGQSISVEIKTLPAGFGSVLNAEEDPEYGVRLVSDEAIALLRSVESVVDGFNRQEIDSQSDYWNVDFFGHVNFASALRN